MAKKIPIYVTNDYEGRFFDNSAPPYSMIKLGSDFEIFSDTLYTGTPYNTETIYELVNHDLCKVNTKFLYHSKEHRLSVIDTNNFYDFLFDAPREVFDTKTDLKRYYDINFPSTKKIYKIRGTDYIYLYDGYQFLKIFKYLNPELYVGRSTLAQGSIFDQYRYIVGRKEFERCSFDPKDLWVDDERPDFKLTTQYQSESGKNDTTTKISPVSEPSNEEDFDSPAGLEILHDDEDPWENFQRNKTACTGIGLLIGIILGFILRMIFGGA